VSQANLRAGDTVLRLDNITKRFGALVANSGVSLDLNRGEVVALLGENGAGKTTLMNILFGHYQADEGRVEVFGQTLPPGNPRAALAAGVGMVHQHFTLADNLSVLDNITLGTESLWSRGKGRTSARVRIAALSSEFGLAVDPDARVGSLSVGERQRIEILKALYREARILILDEPTAVLTPQETDALFDTLRKAIALGLSIIFISHKLHEVMAIADRCVVLRHGKVVGQVETHATDRAALAAMMVGSAVALPKAETRPAGPVLMRLSKVTTRAKGTAIGLSDLSLDLCAGQIVGLAGVSGNGQAVLADLISGLVRPDQGRIEIDGAEPAAWSPRQAVNHQIARIPEDRHKTGTISDFNLTENAVLEAYSRPPFSRHGWMNWPAAQAFAKDVIA
jgi:simple sugar transport system ATP-binding protein